MNIYGVGNDIIEIERIENAIVKNEKFLKRVFTQSEIEYAEKNKIPYPTYSGRFAAKEAFFKAIGTGIREYNLNDIEILNDDKGKPYINILKEEFKKEIIEKKLEFFVTISHSRYNAISTVIAVINEAD